MKFLFSVFAVATCLLAIKADNEFCQEFDQAQEGLSQISKKPETFVRVILDQIASKIEGNRRVLFSVMSPLALLFKGILEVVDAIASFTFPSGKTVFDIIQEALLFALKIFVGHKKSVLASWTKFVGLIFEGVKRLYLAFKPSLWKLLNNLTKQ